MEIVMKKKKTFCPRKEHLAMIAAAVGIGMALAFWCLVWPVTGARRTAPGRRLPAPAAYR